MGQRLVSVVICHLTGSLIDRCLDSVRKSEGVTLEVFVMSSDAARCLAEVDNVDVRWVYDTTGPAQKRNTGVALTRGETIAFLDDDVEVSPYCLYELDQFLQIHPTVGMGFAKIYKMEEGRRNELDACGSWLTPTGFLWDRAGNGQLDRGQYAEAGPILSAKSAICAARRVAFRQVGGFDRDYYILGEETDLSWRLWLQGWANWFVPTAVGWHAFGCETLKPKARHYTDERIFYRGCKNYLSLLWTNLGTGRLCLILPGHLLAWLCAAGGFYARRYPNRALSIMRAVLHFIRDLPHLQRKRHGVQSTRVRTDRELWPLIGYSPPLRYYTNRLWRYLGQGLHG